MNDKFQEALQRAGELTLNGRLSEATAAIQQALGRGPVPAPQGRSRMPATGTGEVIDVEARVIDEPSGRRGTEGRAPAGPSKPAPTAREKPAGVPTPGSFSTGKHRCAAGARDYKLYRPAGPPAGGGRPALVVMLHGCTQDPDDFAAGTRMNALAETLGWWVLYPAQSRSANSSGCWNWFKPGDQQRGGGEPEILADMAKTLVVRHGLDPARVFVAGLSAGGAMAMTLGATHPELFAAVGVHSGLPHASAHDLMSALSAMRQGAPGPGLAHPLRAIVFHGDADNTVHPCNGEAVARQAHTTSADAVEGAALETEKARAAGGRRYTRSLHRDGQGRIDTEHWLIHGAGHAWAGGSAAGSYTDPQGPDASAEMLRFFQA